ncbi:hypothetical protein C8R46DRAFT_1232932 [Mycena filopes]|nr:hypothetical protein C8R46DRAFT_1232932 [Mycena filopes]
MIQASNVTLPAIHCGLSPAAAVFHDLNDVQVLLHTPGHTIAGHPSEAGHSRARRHGDALHSNGVVFARVSSMRRPQFRARRSHPIPSISLEFSLPPRSPLLPLTTPLHIPLHPPATRGQDLSYPRSSSSAPLAPLVPVPVPASRLMCCSLPYPRLATLAFAEWGLPSPTTRAAPSPVRRHTFLPLASLPSFRPLSACCLYLFKDKDAAVNKA